VRFACVPAVGPHLPPARHLISFASGVMASEIEGDGRLGPGYWLKNQKLYQVLMRQFPTH
jgi:hypothetical protein